MKKVSVIVPVYNSESSIKRCVESLVEGTYKELEVLLIDDCSKDQSLEQCKELENTYEQVICLKNQTNQGVSATRNRGLRQATGTYLMFLDSDDWVEANYVEMFVKTMEQEQVPLVISGYVNHDEVRNGRTDIFGFEGVEDLAKTDYRECLSTLFENCLIQILWNKIFLLETVKTNQIVFDEGISIGEDFRFVLQYLECMQDTEIALLNKPLYHYMRDNPNSLMSAAKLANIDEILWNQKKMKELLGESNSKIQSYLKQEREKQIELYAYLIYRNLSYSKYEKKMLMKQLDAKRWKVLYQKNRILELKEKISRIIKGKIT